MATIPRPVIFVSALIASSLLGDQALYVILPVAYPSLGLSPLSVGFLLSTNRWVRLFTNVPAAWLLGSKPIRQIFFIVLVVGSSCSLAYAATTNLFLLLLARAAWGSCWSIIRLAGLVTLTDVCEAGLAAESSLGHLSGIHSGLSRIGSLVGLGLGGIGLDVLGFQAFFVLVGLLSLATSPLALGCAFGTLPKYSQTAVRRLEQLEQERLKGARCGALARCAAMSASEWRLAFLAFASTCAGQGMVMSTLGVLLAPGGARHQSDHEMVNLGMFGSAVPLASATGVILALRWLFEIGAAPLFGRLIDLVGQAIVCPLFFGLCALNGAVGFWMLWGLEHAPAVAAEDASMLPLVVSVVCFFVVVSGADLSVNAQGVAQRQTTVLVIGSDLGAAVGPMLGYAILQMRMPPSRILLVQAVLHATAACIGGCNSSCPCRRRRTAGRERLRDGPVEVPVEEG